MVSVGDILARDSETTEVISQPLFGRGESLMLWAESGIGKSLFTLHWMVALASGRNFGPWVTLGPQKICYLDMEMSAPEITDRLKDAKRGNYFNKRAMENLNVLSDAFTSSTDWMDSRFDLNDSDDVCSLIEHLKTQSIDILVIDNLTTASDSITSENDAAATRSVLSNLKRIILRGVSVVLIHHSTKASSTYRGSSALESFFNTVVRAESVSKSDGPCLDIVAKKCRSGRFKVNDKWRWSFKSGVWTETTTEGDEWLSHVLTTAENGAFATQKDLASALKSTATEISRAKKRLLVAGKVTSAEWESFFGRSS